MNTDQNILQGLQQLLYGNARYRLIREKVNRVGIDILEPFWEVPATPGEYIQNKSVIAGLAIPTETEGIPEEWPRRYYQPVQAEQEDETMILRFYRTYTVAEIKLLLHRLSEMVEELELTLLAYILIETRDGLIGLLKDLSHSPPVTGTNSEVVGEEQCKKLIHDEVVACLMDLELRFGHLMEDRTVGYDKLFLLKLGQKMPATPQIFLTPKGAAYYLGKEKISHGALKEITTRLQRHYKAVTECSTETKRAAHQTVQIIENAWIFGELCIRLKKKPFLPDQTFEDAGKQIHRLIKRIRDNKVNSETLKTMYKINNKADTLHLFLGDHPGIPARKLLGRVEVSGNEEASSSKGTNKSSFNPASQYIHLDDVVNEMGLKKKTVLSYMKRVGLDVSKFSDKVSMIHQKEVERLFEVHKETLTDEKK